MIIENLTSQGADILKNHYGFRDESLYGEGYVDFAEVMKHETWELGNVGIYDTVFRLYCVAVPYENPQEEFEVDTNNEVVLAHFREILNSDTLYCKWLCAKEDDVHYCYGSGFENVAKWIVPENAAIADDMGREGCLVVSSKMVLEERNGG